MYLLTYMHTCIYLNVCMCSFIHIQMHKTHRHNIGINRRSYIYLHTCVYIYVCCALNRNYWSCTIHKHIHIFQLCSTSGWQLQPSQNMQSKWTNDHKHAEVKRSLNLPSCCTCTSKPTQPMERIGNPIAKHLLEKSSLEIPNCQHVGGPSGQIWNHSQARNAFCVECLPNP